MMVRGSAGALALLCILVVTVGHSALAQKPPTQPMADDCRTRPQEPKSVLERRKSELEGRIEAVRKALEKARDDTPRFKQSEDELRRLKEDLLEVLFASDCVQQPSAAGGERAAPAAPPPAAPAPRMMRSMQATPPMVGSAPPPPASASPQTQPQTVEITTYYATNRKRAAAPATPADTFSNDGVGDLTFGRARVSIPLSHTAGNIEQPQLWKFERTADPNKHFVLTSVAPLPTDAARAELSERLKSLSGKSMLVYVHGYNMGFQEAALRTAQLAYDLKFPGVPFFYSWPSANRIRSYMQDEDTARLCEGVFEKIVSELSTLPVEEIYVVAHSMGNRIVGHGLQQYVERGKNTKVIKELLLAAPDINAELFKSTIAPALAQMQGTRTTIYASSFDLALMASKVVHGFRRVGESSGGVLVFNGLDTVDASGASPSTRNFGHSYLVDSTSVIKDLHAIIGGRLAAKARGLIQQGAEPQVYWQLPATP